MLAFGGAVEGACDGIIGNGVNPEAMLDPFIIEGQLIGTAAVVSGGVAQQLLGVVDVTEAAEGNIGTVDGVGGNHHILPGKETLPGFGGTARYGVMGCENAGKIGVKLGRKAQNQLIDQCCGILVFGFLIGSGEESPQPPPVEAGDCKDLDATSRGGNRVHGGLGVNVEVFQIPGGFLDNIESTGVVVVLGTEQQDNGVAVLAQGPQESADCIVYIVKGRICPDTGTVEKVTGDHGNVGGYDLGFLDNVAHAAEGVQPAEVLAVFRGAGQVA